MAALQDLINHVPIFARNLPILLVDNDEASLTSLASTLEKFSYQVTTTTSRSLALSIIRGQQNGHFKLVMENVNMFDSESILFIHQIVKEHIPIVLIVSSDKMENAGTALAEGASFCLERPLSLTDVKNIWQHAFRCILTNNNQFVERTIDMSADNNCNPGMDPPRKEAIIVDASIPQISSSIKRKGIDDDADGAAKKLKAADVEETSVDEEEEDVATSKENEESSNRKPRRIVWTRELHLKFTAALTALGDTRARPKSILQRMNVPNLTQRQVASHLQKYKSQVQRISDIAAGGSSDKSFQIFDDAEAAAAAAETLFNGGSSSSSQSQQWEMNFTNNSDINYLPPPPPPAAISLHDPSNPPIFGGESYAANPITDCVQQQQLDGDNSSASLGATFEPISETQAPTYNLVDTTTDDLYNNISDEGSQMLFDFSDEPILHDSNHYLEGFPDIFPGNN